MSVFQKQMKHIHIDNTLFFLIFVSENAKLKN